MLTSALMFGHQILICDFCTTLETLTIITLHCFSYFCGAAPLLLTKSAVIRVDKMVGLREGLAAG